jgi:hypothetical protein
MPAWSKRRLKTQQALTDRLPGTRMTSSLQEVVVTGYRGSLEQAINIKRDHGCRG